MEIKIKSKGNRLIDWQDLKPFQGNLKKADKEDIEKLKVIIKRRGWTVPIAVWQDNILDGHGRLEALKSLINEGYTVGKIPVIDIEAKDKKEASEILLEINSRANKMTDEGLYEFIQEFGIQEYDFDNLNFPDIDIDKFMDGMVEDEVVEDDVPEVPVEARTKLGDIYELGEHRVMCGDSTSKEDVERLINNNKIDMVFTDPPYGINEKGDRSNRGGLTQGNKLKDFKDDSIEYAIKAYQICETLNIPRQVWWGANYYCHHLPQTNNWFIWDKRVEEKQKDTQSDCEMAWVKSKWSSVRIFRHLWKGMMKGSEHGIKRVHPTQKPIALAVWSFDYYKENVINILDLFLGSGSTLIACEQTNRKCYGMELDEKYCDVIVQRYVDFTGTNKIKLNGKEIEWQNITPKS